MNIIIQHLRKHAPFIDKHSEIFSEITSFIMIIIFVVIPVRMYVAQPFRVSGDSMINTFHNKDYLIVDQLSYNFVSPKRGDVVVLRHPESNHFLIKRIIGLPGETVVVTGANVSIRNSEYPDGFPLDESFLDNPGDEYPQEFIVTDDHYFVMGDNRPYSSDSRSWGLLPRENITGRPILRLYPFTNIEVFPGLIQEYTNNT